VISLDPDLWGLMCLSVHTDLLDGREEMWTWSCVWDWMLSLGVFT
jgi:hypothetical protein